MAIFVSETENHQAPFAPVGSVPSGGTPTGAVELPYSDGIPVTPIASTPLDHFQFLICGIDTLDLGLYVLWGSGWKQRLRTLDQKKQQARKTGGILIKLPSGRTCIFKPGGKGENYRFHLQFDAYNVFIGKAARPGVAPNVYLSIASATLWLQGIDTAMAWIAEDIKAIGGGVIQSVKVSRIDLCTDFHIPGGITHEFLLAHKVTRNDYEKLYRGNNTLETYYVGDASSPIQVRIYNKGLEVQKMGTKLWFLGLWDLDSPADVWRCEYQMRRPVLKEFDVNRSSSQDIPAACLLYQKKMGS